MLSNWIRSRVPVARATFSSVRVDGGVRPLSNRATADRVLENGRLLLLDGPSYRTRHLDLPAEDTQQNFRNPQSRCSGRH